MFSGGALARVAPPPTLTPPADYSHNLNLVQTRNLQEEFLR